MVRDLLAEIPQQKTSKHQQISIFINDLLSPNAHKPVHNLRLWEKFVWEMFLKHTKKSNNLWVYSNKSQSILLIALNLFSVKKGHMTYEQVGQM